jgi:glycosyltransferase involved in cell wall biosynthesis
MPDFYRSVDAVIMSSLQEGGAMPPYEAAAAGRLVIGTPVGDFPRLCLEGLGILGPLDDRLFEDFAVGVLMRYKADDALFRLRCEHTRTAARRNRDWGVVMPEWQRFIEDSMRSKGQS